LAHAFGVHFSDYKSDYVVGEIEIPPVKTRGKSTSWRLGVLTCLAKTGAVAGLFAFSDYFSDYIFEEISRSEIEDVGGCNGWS
jgi:hypothetical protein